MKLIDYNYMVDRATAYVTEGFGLYITIGGAIKDEAYSAILGIGIYAAGKMISSIAEEKRNLTRFQNKSRKDLEGKVHE